MAKSDRFKIFTGDFRNNLSRRKQKEILDTVASMSKALKRLGVSAEEATKNLLNNNIISQKGEHDGRPTSK